MKESKVILVLKRLQAAGEEGVHSFDLQKVGGWRYAARIYDLKNDFGYEITSRPEKRGQSMGCRYYLK